MNAAQPITDHFLLFKTLLNEQIEYLETTNQYLADLKESIQSNNLEALQKLVKTNVIPLSQIEALEESRFSLTEQCGYKRNKEGFIACLKACDNDAQVLNELQIKLFDTMKQLKEATQVNDLLIGKSKKRVQDSIHILTGMTLLKDQTYSNKGTKDHGGRSRTIAKA